MRIGLIVTVLIVMLIVMLIVSTLFGYLLVQEDLALNQVEYNLTHPFMELLVQNYTMTLRPYNVTYIGQSMNNFTPFYPNYTVTWGRLNLSFNAPYPGYLIFNGTATLANNDPALTRTVSNNNPSLCSWIVYVSNQKPTYRNLSTVPEPDITLFYHYFGNSRLFINLTSAAWVYLCPIQSLTYHIPLNKGENYIIIDNENSAEAITITFSAKYVGFHTS